MSQFLVHNKGTTTLGSLKSVMAFCLVFLMIYHMAEQCIMFYTSEDIGLHTCVFCVRICIQYDLNKKSWYHKDLKPY